MLGALQEFVYGPVEVAAPVVGEVKEVGPNWEVHHLPLPVLVAVPTGEGPFPLLVGLNFDGLHTVAKNPHLPTPPGSTKARGCAEETWSIDRLNRAGWAVATAFVGDAEPDDAAQSTGNAVSKWAAGLVTMAEHLAQDPRVDARRIVAVGHSRLGKAALWATASSHRFAGVVGIQSGCGGAAPSRTDTGERVANITSMFPHWFAPTFASFADCVDELPLDQHWLLALAADRPVMLANAEDDVWANPFGQHEMLRLTAEAYGESLPDLTLNQTVGSRLSHFYRPGGHEVNAVDWDAILPWLVAHFPQSQGPASTG